MWQCRHCHNDVKPPKRNCPVCNQSTDIPFHIALAGEDEPNLLHRFDAFSSVEKAKLQQYVARISQLIALSFNMHEGDFHCWASDTRVKYSNLHDRLEAGMLMEYDKENAAKRRGVDNMLFGSAGRHLVPAALNLGTYGLYSYGAVCVFLNITDDVKALTSFLEDNPYSYADTPGPNLSVVVPKGVRALWHTVSILAVVKHHAELLNSTQLSDRELAELLLYSIGDKMSDRFIEAQILYDIPATSVVRVIYDRAKATQVRSHGLVGMASHLSKEHFAHILEELKADGVQVDIL